MKHALLFWNAICKEEIKRGESSLNLISACGESLVGIVLQAMKYQELDDDETTLQESNDDERWLVANAAAGLLTDVAFLIKDMVWPIVWKFFQEQISDVKW
jgi:hypothetical protein